LRVAAEQFEELMSEKKKIDTRPGHRDVREVIYTFLYSIPSSWNATEEQKKTYQDELERLACEVFLHKNIAKDLRRGAKTMSYDRFKIYTEELNERLLGIAKLRSFIDVRNEKNTNPRTALQKALERKDEDRERIAIWLITIGANPKKITDPKLRQEALELTKKARDLHAQEELKKKKAQNLSKSHLKCESSIKASQTHVEDYNIVEVDAMMSTYTSSNAESDDEQGNKENKTFKEDIPLPPRPVPTKSYDDIGLEDDDEEEEERNAKEDEKKTEIKKDNEESEEKDVKKDEGEEEKEVTEKEKEIVYEAPPPTPPPSSSSPSIENTKPEVKEETIKSSPERRNEKSLQKRPKTCCGIKGEMNVECVIS